MRQQKTRGHLLVSYPGEPTYRLDLLKEFSYSSDVMAIGDVSEFTVVNERDGSTLRKLRSGATVKVYLSNPAVNGGSDTLKHYGRIVARQTGAASGVVKVVAPDLGWHLMNSDAPLFMRTRGLTLDELVNPLRYRKGKAGKVLPPFIDESFQIQGLRTGLDANQLNRNLKQGRAGTLAFQNKVLTPVNVIQVEAGETFYDVISRYLQRFNLLLNVSCDGYLQVWNPNYDRKPAYRIYKTAAAQNVIDAKRHDDISERYTEVTCVGELINKFLANPSDPNATKIRGYYRAAYKDGLPAPVPFVHRKTKGDGEMFTQTMAQKQAEWIWKRGMFNSHYLEVDLVDHHQGDRWLEADELCEVDIPELDAQGIYYVQSAHCLSTVDGGDVTKLVLRWPHLLSASFGEWPNPPIYYSAEAKDAAATKGKGGASGGNK